jgi:hypothetical protein
MRSVTSILAFAFVVCLMIGCPNPGNEPTVYTAGYYYSSAEGHNVPCYWTGTARTDLSVPTGADYVIAKSIYVDDGAVYTAGFYMVGIRGVPCYWDGSGYYELENDLTNDSRATSIWVDNGTVYSAGYRIDDGGLMLPCYWVGASRTDLPITGSTGWASSICVDAGIVYVAGSDELSPRAACYWTDDGSGAVQTLLPSDGSNMAEGHAIAVTGGTVYVAGRYDVAGATPPKACYWVGDDTRVALPGFGTEDYSAAIAICVSGGTIYTAGSAETGSTMSSCLWVGTTWAGLTAPDTSEINATGIDVVQGISYISGTWYDSELDEYIPCYWSGTWSTGITRQDLPGSETTAKAFGIFVVE